MPTEYENSLLELARRERQRTEDRRKQETEQLPELNLSSLLSGLAQSEIRAASQGIPVPDTTEPGLEVEFDTFDTQVDESLARYSHLVDRRDPLQIRVPLERLWETTEDFPPPPIRPSMSGATVVSQRGEDGRFHPVENSSPPRRNPVRATTASVTRENTPKPVEGPSLLDRVMGGDFLDD